MNKIYFLIGASGAGKTTAVKELEKGRNDIQFCYFDSIGVPSNEEMVKEYGSGENWQKAKTIEWVKRIKKEFLKDKPVILDVQTRPEFIQIACQENNIQNYQVILFDCSDEIRTQRLIVRGRPELANKEMLNWANFLRSESKKYNYSIVDTSGILLSDMASTLEKALQ